MPEGRYLFFGKKLFLHGAYCNDESGKVKILCLSLQTLDYC
jgi:hypothetical protein